MTALDDVLAAIGRCIESENDSEERTASVADLLLELAGPPSKDGVNSGSDRILKEVAVEAKRRFAARARRFSFDYLRQLRRTAHRFPPGERSPGIPFSLLIVACDPQTLRDAMAQANEEGRKCSAAYIRKYREFKQQQKGDADESSDFTRLQETQRKLILDTRFYVEITKTCADLACEWTNEDRNALASAGRDLVKAVGQLIWAVEPTPMRQAAE
jgi:hypothetical protein